MLVHVEHDTSVKMPKERIERESNKCVDNTRVSENLTTYSSLRFLFWSQGRVKDLFVQGLAGWHLLANK